jgi:hypothetical protein
LEIGKTSGQYVFAEISTTIKRLKGWLRYLLGQEFHNNQDDNNDGEHVDEPPCVREAGND